MLSCWRSHLLVLPMPSFALQTVDSFTAKTAVWSLGHSNGIHGGFQADFFCLAFIAAFLCFLVHYHHRMLISEISPKALAGLHITHTCVCACMCIRERLSNNTLGWQSTTDHGQIPDRPVGVWKNSGHHFVSIHRVPSHPEEETTRKNFNVKSTVGNSWKETTASFSMWDVWRGIRSSHRLSAKPVSIAKSRTFLLSIRRQIHPLQA